MRRLLEREIKYLEEHGRFRETRKYTQHGTCSVYDHCVKVAEMSMKINHVLKLHANQKKLIRGALLHDYFLYDWHDPKNGHSPHGFTHPATALKNAVRDYQLTDVEQNIIARHMFPLTIIPPKCREAWIVCMADKICALQETTLPLGKKVAKNKEEIRRSKKK